MAADGAKGDRFGALVRLRHGEHGTIHLGGYAAADAAGPVLPFPGGLPQPIAVAQGGHGLLSHKDLAAELTMLAFRQAGLGTGGGYGGVDDFLVPGGGNNLLLHKDLVADRAMLTLSQASFRASWSNGSIYDFGVALCRDYLLFYEDSFTDGTMLPFGQARIRAGGGYSFINNFRMPLGAAYIRNGVGDVAAVAFGGLGAVRGAGGVVVGNVVGEAVAQLAAHVRYGIRRAAAMVALGRLGAVLGAGGVAVGDVVGEAVIQLAALVRDGIRSAAAIVTESCLGPVRGAGGAALVRDIVRERMGHALRIAAIVPLAGMGMFGAVFRIDGARAPVVAQSFDRHRLRNLVLCLLVAVHSTALRTFPVVLHSIIRTGSRINSLFADIKSGLVDQCVHIGGQIIQVADLNYLVKINWISPPVHLVMAVIALRNGLGFAQIIHAGDQIDAVPRDRVFFGAFLCPCFLHGRQH